MTLPTLGASIVQIYEQETAQIDAVPLPCEIFTDEWKTRSLLMTSAYVIYSIDGYLRR